jgi:hypothetical protein
MDSLNEVVAGEGANGADLCRVQDFLFGLSHMDSKELSAAHIRFDRMRYTDVIRSRAGRRIYWTMVSVDTSAIALVEQTHASQCVAQASFDAAQWLHPRHSADQPGA